MIRGVLDGNWCRSEWADAKGICTPRCRLLSDELGLPPERISKNGPGSELLFGRLREDQEETAKEEKQHA